MFEFTTKHTNPIFNKIPNIKWYKDKHYESGKKHIVTFEPIPVGALKLRDKDNFK